MRPTGLWHPRLLEVLAGCGHGDLVVVADAGLPIPPGVERVDLVWRSEEPALVPVLEAVLAECVVEHATLATELTDPAMRAGLRAALGTISVQQVPHEQLKTMSQQARAAVRTGATTAYANVVLRCGVAF